jgi:hypothetical protein
VVIRVVDSQRSVVRAYSLRYRDTHTHSHVGLKCYRYHTGDDESKWKEARGLDRRTREKVIRRWRIGVPLGFAFDDTIPYTRGSGKLNGLAISRGVVRGLYACLA